MIVKVQIPLAGSDPNAPALIYNERRTVQVFVPVNERFAKDCKETGKAYYRVRMRDEDKVQILERVEDQPW